ncbi:MAG TPA: hypothetical protein VF682_24115 [Pseudomonas sp.]
MTAIWYRALLARRPIDCRANGAHQAEKTLSHSSTRFNVMPLLPLITTA